MKRLRLTAMLLLVLFFSKGSAQTNFEWTKTSVYFTHGVSDLVSYIDLGDIRYWGYMEISLTGFFNNENTTGLYRKIYSIGTNTTTTVFYSNTSEVAAAIGPVSTQWKLGEFQRDASNHLVVPIYHLTANGNYITVCVKGITVTPINTSVFAITTPAVVANTQVRDYNYINGKLALGSVKPDADALLTVAGNINARELKVKIDAGADFVFDKNYKLPDLESVEKYIKANGHLQNIPSAKEMKNNGLEVGDFQIKLLQKIEELTLHLIETNKENDCERLKLQKIIEQQQEDIKSLKSKIGI